MSQFKKALLKKYLSKENEEENESGSEGQQQVGSVQKNQKVLLVMELWWKKIHQILTFP